MVNPSPKEEIEPSVSDFEVSRAFVVLPEAVVDEAMTKREKASSVGVVPPPLFSFPLSGIGSSSLQAENTPQVKNAAAQAAKK